MLKGTIDFYHFILFLICCRYQLICLGWYRPNSPTIIIQWKELNFDFEENAFKTGLCFDAYDKFLPNWV